MKDFLLIMTFIISPFALMCQEYTPFLEGNPIWKVYGIDNAQPNEESTTDVEYSLAGDTIIEGADYRILDVETAPATYLYPFIEEAYLRENLETRKVYIRFKEEDQALFGGNEELLLYDFSLNEGDSFFLYEDFDGNEVNILSETTIDIDGQTRDSWLTDFPSIGNTVGKTYVEGVGFLSDLLLPVLYEEYSFYSAFTYCYKNASENISHNFTSELFPDDLDCNSTLSLENTEGENQVLIYPNPSSDGTTIELPDLKEVRVSDLLGKVVFEEKTIESEKIGLNTVHWAEGLYLVKACNGKSECALERLVIKH